MMTNKNSTFPDSVSNILKIILFIFLAAYVAFFIYISFNHIKYPNELEWIEGGYLLQCQRVAEGKPIYISPENPDFIPYVYTPVYFYLVGFLGKIFGISFTLARMVSFLSILGTGILIFLIIKKETGNFGSAFVGSAFLFSAYSFSGYWYDVVRSDSLFMLLIVTAFYLIRFQGNSHLMLVLSSFILVLAFLTKQSVVYFIGFSALTFLFIDYKKTLNIIISTALIGSILVFIINRITSGWFWFYIYKLCADSEFPFELLPDFLELHILEGLPFLMIMLIIFCVGNRDRFKDFFRSPSSIWFWGFCAGFVCSTTTMIFPGGFLNGLIPLICFSSIASGIAYHHLSSKRFTKLAALILLILQLIIFRYDPRPQLASARDYEMGQRLINYISNIPSDEVLVFKHSYYPVMCGKKPQIHFGALHDFLVVKDRSNPEQFYDKFRNRVFDVIILDERFGEENPVGMDRMILDNYYFKEQLFPDGEDGFYTKTGPRTRPNYVYFPREENLGLFEDYDPAKQHEPPPDADPAMLIQPMGL